MYPGTRTDLGSRESDLLISLSTGSRVLKNCTSEDIKDVLCELAVATRTGADHDDGDGSRTNEGESFYTGFLVGLLQSHSKLVQYAAGKTLVALSDSLRRTRADAWAAFLDYLWTVVKGWVSVPSSVCGQCLRSIAYSEQPSRNETCIENPELEPLQRDQSKLVGDSLEAKNWLAASNAVDLLQRILKACLRNSRGALLDVITFLKLFIENITVLATSACTEQSLSHCAQCRAKREMLAKEDRSILPTGAPKELFLGSLLRLVCTATHVTDSTSHFKVGDHATAEQFLDVMEAVIPAVSSSVLAHHRSCDSNNCLSPYLCHKLLMVMTRLSECFGARPSLALSCCDSLRSFGGGLLGFSLLDSASEADSLADSPFLASMAPISQKARALSVKHLQRRALYILFKIVSSMHRCPTSGNVIPISEILIGWLDRQVQPATAVPGLAGKRCIQGCGFLDQLAKSFVELYFDEDDLMLKMLLLLSSKPSLLSALTTPENPNNSERWNLAAMALTAERVFHSFLGAIQFNSSVLIDFLISEDSGALCVLYLMRSIRCVIDSWPEFLNSAPRNNLPDEEVDSSLGPDQDKSELDTQGTETFVFGKRKRSKEAIRENTSDSQGNGLKMDWCCSDRMSTYGTNSVLRREANCLLQLKLSIERLHRRSLFPYNPSALLRRFDTILELLDKHLLVQKPAINI